MPVAATFPLSDVAAAYDAFRGGRKIREDPPAHGRLTAGWGGRLPWWDPRVPRPNHRMGPALDRFLADNSSRLICIRRDLHSNPEVGWHEHRTSAVVASLLDEVGLTPAIRQGTALVYDIHVGEPSEGDDIATVALRADLDALPYSGREAG